MRLNRGVLIPEFGPQENRGPNPVSPPDQVFRVSRLKACPLAPHIIEELITNRDVIVRTDLMLQVVDDRVLRSEARKLRCRFTNRSVRIRLRYDGIGGIRYVWHILHPHVPIFGRVVPVFADYVIPRGIVGLQIVLSVVSTVGGIVMNVDNSQCKKRNLRCDKNDVQHASLPPQVRSCCRSRLRLLDSTSTGVQQEFRCSRVVKISRGSKG